MSVHARETEHVNSDPRTVAVLVVHGVADQTPHQSAQCIADLLLRLDAGDRGRYAGVDVRGLVIPVGPVATRGAGTTTFRQRTRELQRSPTEAAPARGDLGLIFMHDQLSGHEPEGRDAVYHTVRLETARTAGPQPPRHVHIYEVYWADLSRLAQGALRVFGELYQLLLHVPSLGRHVVDAAAVDDARGSKSWEVLRRAENIASYLLAVPIAILNLWLLAVASVALSAPLVVSMLPPAIRPLPGLVGLALIVTAVAVFLLVGRGLRGWLWTLAPFAIVGMLVPAYPVVLGWGWSYHLFAYVALALIGAAAYALVNAYRHRRPESWRFAAASGAVVAAGLATTLAIAPPTEAGVLSAGLEVIEFLYVAVMLTWGVFFLTLIVAWIAGRLAVWRAGDDDRADRLRRAERTAHLTLAIPAVSFIVVTVILWSGLYHATKALVAKAPYSIVLLDRFTSVAEPIDHVGLAWQLLALATSEIVFVLALGGLALFLGLWGLLPAAIAEIRRPGADSASLGGWLNRGFLLLRFCGTLVMLGAGLIGPLLVVQQVLGKTEFGQWLGGISAAPSERALQVLGVLVAGSAVGLLAFGGGLRKLAGGFRPILDVLLDVDNYLREHPLDNNPRARICARYVAVLRHICRWKNEHGRPYDALVIVAHSQGTVITADLLRFLRAYPDPNLEALGATLPVHLFTMGSPLRQLYGLRFPHLYRWARHQDRTTWSTWTSGDVPETQAPSPCELGVKSWVNAFASSDYVGRHLWRSDRCDYAWAEPCDESAGTRPLRKFVSADASSSREEFCIGAGAHTHYWDGTSPLIGSVLDRLIGSV